MHRLNVIAITVWLPLAFCLPQLKQSIIPTEDQGRTLPMSVDEPHIKQSPNLVDGNPALDSEILLRDRIAEAALWAAMSTTVIGSTLGLQRIQNARERKLHTPKGHALREVERLKDYIPWTKPEHWCVRLCVMHRMQDSEHWREGATGQPPTLEEAYYMCQAASHCNVPDRYQIAQPPARSKVEERAQTVKQGYDEKRKDGLEKGRGQFRQLGYNARESLGGVMRGIGGAIRAGHKVPGSIHGVSGTVVRSALSPYPL
ncbi:MAG: hypothetical protein M1816_000214 [Peltula sp. TS41687]|nr:MAG: hypothetical protein M1816_000214 [Peltula sp. TS41687]